MRFTTPIPVLLTVPHLNPTASPYRETMAIARYLPREEFKLTICALRPKGVPESIPVLRHWGVDAFVARFRPTKQSPAGYLKSLREQRSIDGRGPFAIQHSLDFTSSPFEALMARCRSRIYIYNQRNMNESGHEILLGLKLRLAHAVIGISGAVMAFLRARGVPERKLRKIWLGIDLDQFDAQLEPSGPRHPGQILLAGQFERRKRHGDAIRALAAVSRDCAEARLALAGNLFDAPYVEELKSLAASLGVADRVDFLGTRNDVPRLMRQSAAVVLCSESEAFGWVILEAMAAGTPVVASAVDGPREVIEHGKTGLLVPPGDIDGYAAALRALLTEPSLGAGLAANARRAAGERFSAAAMVADIANLYRELLKPPHAAIHNDD